MKIISVANHKGGCGKTATTHALGVVLSARHRVLLIDADAQGSLTGACGIGDVPTPTLADVLRGKVEVARAIHPLTDRLSLVPATIDLAEVELEMVTRSGRESVLRKALARVHDFDVVLIDCGPGIGIMTLNALVAAHGVIVPTQPQAQDLRGLSLFLQTIEAVQSDLNPGLALIGILPTFYSAQLSHHGAALEEIKRNGLKVLTPIGRSVRVAEASAAGKSIVEYAPDNPQAYAYMELGKEIEQWLKQNQA